MLPTSVSYLVAPVLRQSSTSGGSTSSFSSYFKMNNKGNLLKHQRQLSRINPHSDSKNQEKLAKHF